MDSVVLSSWADEPRFRQIIDSAIEAGELPQFEQYSKTGNTLK